MINSELISLVLAAAGLLGVPAPAALLRKGPHRSIGRALPPAWRRAMVAAAGVLAIGVVLGLWPWWFGMLVATGSGVLVFRLPARTSAADRGDDRRRLAVHADLLAACLDAGMSVGAALLAVGSDSSRGGSGHAASDSPHSGSGDPPARQDPLRLLDGVAALLMLGADPESAWRTAQAHPDLAALAAAAKRSSVGGAGFADAVREHAVNLRAATAAAADRSAGRAGVAMTAPLGLCFLPAFLCLGLAPVVVGLLSTLHLF